MERCSIVAKIVAVRSKFVAAKLRLQDAVHQLPDLAVHQLLSLAVLHHLSLAATNHI